MFYTSGNLKKLTRVNSKKFNRKFWKILKNRIHCTNGNIFKYTCDINKQFFENTKHSDGITFRPIYLSQKMGKGDQLIEFARFKFC